MKHVHKFDPKTGNILEEQQDERQKALNDANCELYKHYKPDMKPVVYSLKNHFDKSIIKGSRMETINTGSMMTENSPSPYQKKDQTKHELDQ